MRKFILSAIFSFLTIVNVHGDKVDYIYNGHLFKDVYYEDFLNDCDEIVTNEVLTNQENDKKGATK